MPVISAFAGIYPVYSFNVEIRYRYEFFAVLGLHMNNTIDNLQNVTRHANKPFDIEISACIAWKAFCVEDDNVTSLRIAEMVCVAVHEKMVSQWKPAFAQDIPLLELPTGGQQDLVARQFRPGVEKSHDIL